MGALRDFWRWWGSELGAVLLGTRRRTTRRLDALAVKVEPGGPVLGRTSQRRPEALRELARLASPADRERVPGLIRKFYRETKTKLEVWLPADNALTCRVQLPAATEENLREVLGFEMERLTPFKADDVYYDGRVVGRDPQARQLDVELRVAPCRVVDQALGALPSQYTHVDRNRVEIRENDDRVIVSFLPPERAPRVTPAFNTFLALVNIGLLAAVVGIPLVEQHNALEEIRFSMRSARTSAAQANSVLEQVDALNDQIRRLVDSKASRPATVEVLEEIAARLPNSTWVYRFEIKDGSLQVSGSSDSAGALIEVLEDSVLLSDARFVSPVTREPGTGRERFHISARIADEDPKRERASVPG